MPGSYVYDANQTKLAAAATLNANANGAAVDAGRPGDTKVRLVVTGTVTGTTPTADIEIQSSDDNTFATGVVSHGRFKQLASTDASSATTHYLNAYVAKRYMRYVVVVGGTTPVFNSVNIDLVDEHYEQTVSDSA